MNCNEISKNCMFNKLRQVSRHVTSIYVKSLKSVGVTPIQYSMMTAIKVLKSANINVLSDAIKMDRTTLNRNLKPLIRDGIVNIGCFEDRREKLVSLTKKGEEIYEKGYDKWKEAQNELENEIGRENWDSMNTLLDDIVKKI